MSKAFTLDSTYVNLRPDDSATTLKNWAALLGQCRETHRPQQRTAGRYHAAKEGLADLGASPGRRRDPDPAVGRAHGALDGEGRDVKDPCGGQKNPAPLKKGSFIHIDNRAAQPLNTIFAKGSHRIH